MHSLAAVCHSLQHCCLTGLKRSQGAGLSAHQQALTMSLIISWNLHHDDGVSAVFLTYHLWLAACGITTYETFHMPKVDEKASAGALAGDESRSALCQQCMPDNAELHMHLKQLCTCAVAHQSLFCFVCGKSTATWLYGSICVHGSAARGRSNEVVKRPLAATYGQ